MQGENTTSTCELFTEVPAAWKAMLEDCKAAQESIYLEQYIFQSYGMGAEFIEVFKQKARSGVDVRLLLDLVGSWTIWLNRSLVKDLRESGVYVRWYNPIAPLFFLRASSFYFRDHRKMLMVDSAVAHLGGVGINPRMASWRDTHGRFLGPIVRTIQTSFLELWIKAKKPIPHLLSKPHPEYSTKPGAFEFLPNSPGKGRRFVYHAMRNAIQRAEKKVWITMPYFIPDFKLFRTLRLAARRGVDVRIILPNRSDLPILDAAMKSYFGMALRSGIKIYTYQPAVLHAKVIVCDDTWATFGSMNWDSVSFRYNLESNIVVGNKVTIAELSAHFTADLDNSTEVLYSEWKKRPVLFRLLEFILWPFHGLL